MTGPAFLNCLSHLQDANGTENGASLPCCTYRLSGSHAPSIAANSTCSLRKRAYPPTSKPPRPKVKLVIQISCGGVEHEPPLRQFAKVVAQFLSERPPHHGCIQQG